MFWRTPTYIVDRFLHFDTRFAFVLARLPGAGRRFLLCRSCVFIGLDLHLFNLRRTRTDLLFMTALLQAIFEDPTWAAVAQECDHQLLAALATLLKYRSAGAKNLP
jgi:hypothetical protein